MLTDYLKKRQEHIFAGRPLREKKVHTLNQVSPKTAAKKAEQKKEEKKKQANGTGKLSLKKWFLDIEEKHWSSGMCCCMECGVAIPRSFAKFATAHLLPKKLFNSIKTHELNYLILGAGCGCHDKTDRVDKFSQMKVWPEAARRIKEMIPLLPFDELKYLSGQLMTALENTP